MGSVGGLVGTNYNNPGDGVNTIMRSTASAAVTATTNSDRHHQTGRRSGRV